MSNKQFIRRLVTSATIIAAFVVCIVYSDNILSFLGKIVSSLKPFIYGGSIAFILNPLYSKIRKRLEKSKSRLLHNRSKVIAIAITEILFLAIVALTCLIIIPQIVISMTDIAKTLPNALKNCELYLSKLLESNEIVKSLLAGRINSIEGTAKQIITSVLIPNMETILGSVLQSATSVGKAIINILMALFINVFALANKDNFSQYMKKLLKVSLGDNKAKLVIDEAIVANNIFSGFLAGKIVDSAIIGVLCFIVMAMFKLPYPLLISVIVGITNIIPVAGPFIGAIPGAVIIFSVNPSQTIAFILIIIVIQQLDGNYIGPKCIGSATNISTFWILFAIVLFGGLWGIVGMLIGVPLLAVILDIVDKVVNKKLNSMNKNAS